MVTTRDIVQIALYFVLLIALTPPLGGYMARVFSGQRHLLSPLLARAESALYRLIGVDPAEEMNWKSYANALLVFNFGGFTLLLLLELCQGFLPLNPRHLPGVPFDLALNTAVSFTTNTNWQSYAGETTMSYLTDMLGLTVQNFLSAATGIAVLLALIRGLVRRTTQGLGSFWVDIVRTTLYVLLPLSVILSIALLSQGVVQNLSDAAAVTTVERAAQVIPQGPAASQIAIKQLGTNGGGFFGANSAFPYENPTPTSNFLQMLAMLLLPSSLVYTYGRMTGSPKHGWVLWSCMLCILLACLTASLVSEAHLNPLLGTASPMEGKEMRFGGPASILWSVLTTATSNGSVNAMHDSLSPLSGFAAILNIMLGEIVFGGVGSGLYGIFLFVLLTVFIAGLMVGRSPEYLGKKIEAFEVQMTVLAVIAPSAVILVFSAVAAICAPGLAGVTNAGPHGLSQILYAFSSAAGNNGSAFAGLTTDTLFYNALTGLGMLIGRFSVIIPVLAIAGSLARKTITPVSSGTFRTDTAMFAFLLVAVIVIVGALTFFPALSLGPVVEHFLMMRGTAF